MALVERDESQLPSPHMAPSSKPPGVQEPPNPKSWRGVVFFGYLILLGFFGGFVGWAAMAPLGSGAIAQGQVQVAGNQKTVQHLEGGIILAINVREGDYVKSGDVLVELEAVQSDVQFDRLAKQYWAMLGREARLVAEAKRQTEIDFPSEILDRAADTEVAEIIDGERRLFEGRRSALDSQVGLLERRVAKSREEIVALKAQSRSDRRQLEIIEEEIDGVRELLDKGLERKPRLLALQRTQAELEGSIENRAALMSRAEQTIAETEYQLLALLDEERSKVESDLRNTQVELSDLRNQMRGVKDTQERSVIRAPQSGQIYGLRFHTTGGVISPGEPILNIVPEDADLVVQARVDPNDIDVVSMGQLAAVRFTSYSQRTSKPIDGEVIYISADVIQPDKGPQYYEARIQLDKDMLRRHDVALLPGMPAMAIINTGEQTLLDYLISPLTRSLETALREN